MPRSLRFERIGPKLVALAAPLLAWAAPAAASPEKLASAAASPEAAPADVAMPDAAPDVASPEAPAPSDVASPETPAAISDDGPAAPAPPSDIAAGPETPAPPALPATAPDTVSPPTAAAAPQALALASTGAASPSALAQVAAGRAAASRSPWIGAMADLGLPDGATMSLVVRPIRAIRAHAGLSHNLISLGQRVGVTWAPLAWWVSPTLSLEYGHYTDGNANPLVRAVSGDGAFSSAVLDRVGYSYANAHLGIELGRRWFTFYVHAGASRITSTIHNLSAATMSESAGTTSVTFSKDPSVRLLTVSARIGFVVYLAK